MTDSTEVLTPAAIRPTMQSRPKHYGTGVFMPKALRVTQDSDHKGSPVDVCVVSYPDNLKAGANRWRPMEVRDGAKTFPDLVTSAADALVASGRGARRAELACAQSSSRDSLARAFVWQTGRVPAPKKRCFCLEQSGRELCSTQAVAHPRVAVGRVSFIGAHSKREVGG